MNKDYQFNLNKSAFTLVELAIVLVIVGLLIGGVLQGQELIKQSHFRKTYSDIQQISSSGNIFKGKYNCLPGDCIRATVFFGTATSCGNLSTTGTCNGNGNNYIATQAGLNADDLNLIESLYIWDHLTEAKLLSGNYTGAWGTALYDYIAGVNVPNGALPESCFGLATLGTRQGETYRFDGDYGHALSLGNCSGSIVNYNALLIPFDAYEFDLKFDDGAATYGNIVSDKGFTTNCTTSTSMGAQYKTDETLKRCVFYIKKIIAD